MTTTETAKERPILFSAAMVQALLREDDPKTQTRRVVKPQPPKNCDMPLFDYSGHGWFFDNLDEDGDCSDVYPDDDTGLRCPYGKPGDRLWVRETFWIEHDSEYFGDRLVDCGADLSDQLSRVLYPATDDDPEPTPYSWTYYSKKPSIHMPRWASRITLELTGVRVERVQDISDDDIQAEGIEPLTPERKTGKIGATYTTFRGCFENLWESINGPRGYGWAANPFVWVLEFRRIEL